ncbi:hypothetical protein [Erwinia mallotivora]|uniref:hypothetical protein n=1 Tax=Erwinia mallotivora TaxID=69222 RepID=UPI0021C179C3|nr:hypothetical protein [Erwinia mallotivora]
MNVSSEKTNHSHAVASLNAGHSSQSKKANAAHLTGKVDAVENICEGFAKISISNNKKVSFSNFIDCRFYHKPDEEKGLFILSKEDVTYRINVDRAAKAHGLMVAVGHDDHKTSLNPYNHAFALSEIAKLG